MKDLSKPGTICNKSESLEAFQSLGATHKLQLFNKRAKHYQADNNSFEEENIETHFTFQVKEIIHTFMSGNLQLNATKTFIKIVILIMNFEGKQ